MFVARINCNGSSWANDSPDRPQDNGLKIRPGSSSHIREGQPGPNVFKLVSFIADDEAK